MYFLTHIFGLFIQINHTHMRAHTPKFCLEVPKSFMGICGGLVFFVLSCALAEHLARGEGPPVGHEGSAEAAGPAAPALARASGRRGGCQPGLIIKPSICLLKDKFQHC